jgi:asparagine N-glycosylation enzyme membrane subunit Stt3
MKNLYALLFATFFCLGILALYLAPQALHRGNLALFFVLIIAAMILFNRLQDKRP